MALATDGSNDVAASTKITRQLDALGDWLGDMLAQVRQLIHNADPKIEEEWKWEKPKSPGTPSVAQASSLKRHNDWLFCR